MTAKDYLTTLIQDRMTRFGETPMEASAQIFNRLVMVILRMFPIDFPPAEGLEDLIAEFDDHAHEFSEVFGFVPDGHVCPKNDEDLETVPRRNWVPVEPEGNWQDPPFDPDPDEETPAKEVDTRDPENQG